jgi:hypothetical protein
MRNRTGERKSLDASREEVAMNEWLDEAGLYLAMPDNTDADNDEEGEDD